MKNLLLLLSAVLLFNIAKAQLTNLRLKQVLVEYYDLTTQQYVAGDSIDYYYSGNNYGYISMYDFVRNEFNHIINFTHYDIHSTPTDIHFVDDYAWYTPHIDFNMQLRYDSAYLYQRTNRQQVKVPILRAYQIMDTFGRIDSFFRERYENISGGSYDTLNTVKNTYGTLMLLSQTHRRKFSRSNTITSRTVYKRNSIGRYDTLLIGDNTSTTDTFVYYYKNNGLIDSIVEYNPTAVRKNYFHFNSNPIFPDNVFSVSYKRLTPQTGDTIYKRSYTYHIVMNTVYTLSEDMERYNVPGWSGMIDTLKQYHIGYRYNKMNGIDIQVIEDTVYYDYAANNGGVQTGLLQAAKRQFHYNKDGLIDTFILEHWDSVAKSWGGGYDSLYGPSHNVYLNYGSVTTIIPLDKESSEIRVYPLPAYELMTIDATLENDEPFEVMIYDVKGSLIKRWNEEGTKQYRRTIPVADIPAGMYILKLSGKEMNVSKRLVIGR